MAGPEVSFDDLRVLRDRGVVALGEDLAALQDRDGVGERGDHREVVLDHQHGAVGRDALDQRGDALQRQPWVDQSTVASGNAWRIRRPVARFVLRQELDRAERSAS